MLLTGSAEFDMFVMAEKKFIKYIYRNFTIILTAVAVNDNEEWRQ